MDDALVRDWDIRLRRNREADDADQDGSSHVRGEIARRSEPIQSPND